MRSSLITTVLLLVAACSGNKSGGGGGGSATGGGAGGGAAGGSGGFGDSGLPDFHPECANSSDNMSQTSLAAARLALADGGDGQADVALSDQGCYRFERTKSGGQITGMRAFRFTGTVDAKLDGGGIDFVVGEKVYAQWAKDPGGALIGNFDADQDGFNERVTTTAPGQLGYWTLSPSSGQMTTRVMETQIGSGLWHMTREGTVNGTFQQVSEAIVADSMPQQACAPVGSGPSVATDCTPGQQAALELLLDNALSQGADCLRNAGMMSSDPFSAQQLDLFAKVYANDVKFKCETGDDEQAHVSTSEIADYNNSVTLYVNIGVIGSNCPGNQQLGTLFHEVMHTVYLQHDPRHELSDITDADNMSSYTDSIYACERFCFGSLQTKSGCARCLKVKVCDPRCGNYASCRRTNDAGVDTMSEAVGAVCDRRLPDGGPDLSSGTPTSGNWYKTKAECQLMCATGPQNCESFSLSCTPGCE